MSDFTARIQLILGREALKKLETARVALFGLGGVGGYALEALVRSGVGNLLLVDNDCFSISNLNRQILALRSTLGCRKTETARERALAINPDCRVEIRDCLFLPETRDLFDFSGFDYVIDAIDTVTAKLCLIRAAQEAGVPVISCMGTGNKTDPSQLRIDRIDRTSVDPLARVMRREYKKRGLAPFSVVYSTEEPMNVREEEKAVIAEEISLRAAQGLSRKDIPGSAVFVPAAAGLLLAQKVVTDLIAR